MNKMFWSALFAWFAGASAHAHTCQQALLIVKPVQAQLVDLIVPGTTVQFEDGKSFQIEAVLSNSGTHGIFLIPGNRVLRIARVNAETLWSYHAGHRALAEQHVPVARQFGANPAQWIVSEFLDIEMLLEDAVSNSGRVSNERFERLLQDFKDFAFKFYRISAVGDLSLEKIAYVRNRGWVMLGSTGEIKIGYKSNPFAKLFDLADTNRNLNPARMQALLEATDSVIAYARGN